MTYIFVVSDSGGFVGAFVSSEEALKICQNYPQIQFVIQRWKFAADGDPTRLWVVLYRHINVVAFVSNKRDDAASVRATLHRIGAVYEDDLDYWEWKIGTIHPRAAERLDAASRGLELIGMPDAAARIQALEQKDLHIIEGISHHRPAVVDYILRGLVPVASIAEEAIDDIDDGTKSDVSDAITPSLPSLPATPVTRLAPPSTASSVSHSPETRSPRSPDSRISPELLHFTLSGSSH